MSARRFGGMRRARSCITSAWAVVYELNNSYKYKMLGAPALMSCVTSTAVTRSTPLRFIEKKSYCSCSHFHVCIDAKASSFYKVMLHNFHSINQFIHRAGLNSFICLRNEFNLERQPLFNHLKVFNRVKWLPKAGMKWPVGTNVLESSTAQFSPSSAQNYLYRAALNQLD
jgi:hypothetical protein